MSSQYLSRREVEDLRPSLDKAIYRCLGYSDSSLLSTASSCLTNGYDRRKTADKLSSMLDSKKAARLAEKILQLADDAISANKSSTPSGGSSQPTGRKRSHQDPPQSGSRDGRHGSSYGSERNEGKRSKGDQNSTADSVKTARGSSSHIEDAKGFRNSKNSRDYTKRENGASKDIGNNEDYGPEKPPDHSALPLDSVGAQMAVLSADKIRLMMDIAQREIEERKRALIALKGEDTRASANPNVAAVSAARAAAAQIKVQILPNSNNSNNSAMPPPGVIKPVLYSQPTTTVSSREDYEKQKRMAELQAKIQSKLAGTRFDTATSGERPRPLILDTEGRAVDHAGRQVMMAQHLPTLKANIRAKKREELKAQLGSKSGPEQEEAAWFDSRVAAKPALRTKRALRFHEPGRFQQMADRIRMKAQLEKLQNEISQIARKTGISSATKMALLAPDLEDLDDIPELEWWDSVILMTEEEKEAASAKALAAGIIRDPDDIAADLKEDAISNLVEHPTQMRPPSEPTKPVYMPVFLTKRERKKLRRQTRREAWKEEQEKVRLGLEAPAEPKLRISNLMRVLGSEAVQDPTKIEAHVREQMAKRRKAHEEANAARRLTREQRGERRANRLKEDTTLGVHVGLYRVQDLFETASKKFKIEKNAQQLFMTGSVLLHRGCCVIITEGGPKQHSKFKRLMLNRIKWSEDKIKDQDGTEVPNTCQLVWEGTAANRSFGEIKFKVCPTERSAREHLAKYRAQHYWDLAYGSAVLGAPCED